MGWFRSHRSHHSARRSGPPGRTRARFATRMLLLVALAVSSVALTQCRMVGDTLNGVRVSAFKRKSDCLKDCKDANKNARKTENDLHAANLSACHGDAACRAAENARHDAAQQVIEAAYVACQNACHNQGGGTVGN